MKLITTDESARIAEVDRRTFMRWKADGIILPVSKIKNRLYFDEDEVKRLASARMPLLNNQANGVVFKTDMVDIQLNAIGLQILKEAKEQMEELHIYDDSYLSTLNLYAIQYQLYLYYITKAQMDEMVTYGGTGGLRVHPFASIADRHLQNFLRMQDTLGLNPKSKNSITRHKSEHEGQSDMSDLFE